MEPQKETLPSRWFYNLEDATMQETQERNPGLLLMLLFLSTFDVHRRDWRALLRRMRLLRLGHKRQKTLVLRMKWQKTMELRKKAKYNPPPLRQISLTASSVETFAPGAPV